MAKPLFKARGKEEDTGDLLTKYFVYLLNSFDPERAESDNFHKVYGRGLEARFKNPEMENDVLEFLRNSPHRLLLETEGLEVVSLNGEYFSGDLYFFYNSDVSSILCIYEMSKVPVDSYIRYAKKSLRDAVVGNLSLCDKSKINGIAEKHWRMVFDNILSNGGSSDDLYSSYYMDLHEPALAELESYGYELKADL